MIQQSECPRCHVKFDFTRKNQIFCDSVCQHRFNSLKRDKSRSNTLYNNLSDLEKDLYLEEIRINVMKEL